MFTTNEEDKREAAKLQASLREDSAAGSTSRSAALVGDGGSFMRVAPVEIAEGAHKYVLIRAIPPTGGGVAQNRQYFVTSKRGASYHRNAAEPMVYKLRQAGYMDIDITGGGRILLDEQAKKISIFGYSHSFGLADHEISRRVILEDPRYRDFEVTTSNEGY